MSGIDYLKNFLQEEGYRYAEEDTFITFKYQGTKFVAFKQDSKFAQVVVICNTESVGRTKTLEVCNTMNSNKYVVKFIVMDGSVWVSYEFEPNQSTPTSEYDYILGVLDKSSDELFEKLNENN